MKYQAPDTSDPEPVPGAAAGRSGGAGLFNICFHGVGRPGRDLEPGEECYWVGRDRFLRLLDELATWPAVRLSFDDGNRSDVETALPALRERGLTADFFPLAGRLGTPGSLDAADLRELRAGGMRIGSHGMWHRPWRRMDPRTRHEELVTARQVLAEAAGGSVEAAACPLGRYDRRVLADLRKLRYRPVYTSDRRPARPGAWLQPRHSVRRDDTVGTLRDDVRASAPLWRRRLAGAVKRIR
jgi:peptidoglycan/xylan/chitin deacetylase (PgdA/CDA1 family)